MTELEALRPTLEVIPITEVEEPNLPVAVVVQEAINLQTKLEADEVRDRVTAVGLDPSRIEGLPVAIAATEQAQSQWMFVRDRAKTQLQRDCETRGEKLRRGLIEACRWNCRDNLRVQRILDTIAQGGGVPDLAQDLRDLAVVMERHSSAFDHDETFDVSEQVQAARQLASEINKGLAGRWASDTQESAKLLRDRAFTYLDRVVSDIRTAGRYAYRDEPRRMLDFTSDYLRRGRQRRARRRREQGETSAQPPTESIMEATGDPSDAAA